MSDELFERLRRLGLTRGARDLKPATVPARTAEHSQYYRSTASGETTLARLIPGGRIEETPIGSCLVVDHVYPLHYKHGRELLSSLLLRSPGDSAVFLGDSRLQSLSYRDVLFLDTETTGLAGAAALAFMVGIAYFESNPAGDVMVVRQYFLRDHGDEPAMLLLLEELAQKKTGMITFNGRSFDIPLLNARYLLNRHASPFDALLHLDLLLPSRRLWRKRLGSVALSNLERELLGVRRTQDDIPGWLIPSVYNDYVRTGDARELSRVFYHNKIDMLSMVTLAIEISRLLETPLTNGIDALDSFCVAKWQADTGQLDAAEQTLRHLLSRDLPLEIYHQTLQQLGSLLKRSDRSAEAVPFWQQWATTSLDDVQGHIELAMYYEWQSKDLAAAAEWTRRAIALTGHWSPGLTAVVRPELDHRLRRIDRKRTV